MMRLLILTILNFGEADTLTGQDAALTESTWCVSGLGPGQLQCHLLATAKDPKARLGSMERGWTEQFGTLLPSKCPKPLPQVITVALIYEK